MINRPHIRIISVERLKNPYWLRFKAYIPSLDKNKEYTFDFCRTEIKTDAPLETEVIENLRLLLSKKFINMPFVLSNCKSILGNGIDYPYDCEE